MVLDLYIFCQIIKSESRTVRYTPPTFLGVPNTLWGRGTPLQVIRNLSGGSYRDIDRDFTLGDQNFGSGCRSQTRNPQDWKWWKIMKNRKFRVCFSWKSIFGASVNRCEILAASIIEVGTISRKEKNLNRKNIFLLGEKWFWKILNRKKIGNFDFFIRKIDFFK